MRRYFDEYRGLRETTGHVERFEIRGVLRRVAGSVAADRRWMGERDIGQLEQARWTARASRPPRRTRRVLGPGFPFGPNSRTDCARCLAGDPSGSDGPADRPASSCVDGPPASTWQARFMSARCAPNGHTPRRWMSQRHGAVPLLEPQPGMAERQTAASGDGHTAVQPRQWRTQHAVSDLFATRAPRSRLQRLGSRRPGATCAPCGPLFCDSDIRDYFAPFNGPVYKEFDEWGGADVVLRPDGRPCIPHYGWTEPTRACTSSTITSPSSTPPPPSGCWPRTRYRHGLHCVAASPWLRDLLIDRYGATRRCVSSSESITTSTARDRCPGEPTRSSSTPKRDTETGGRVRGDLLSRSCIGDAPTSGSCCSAPCPERRTPRFPTCTSACSAAEQLSRLYSEATVGLCLSLTNFSLIPKEMLACGLPCVELAGVSGESIFGANGPLELASSIRSVLADALQRLLDDRELRRAAVTTGHRVRLVRHTWDRATDDVEAGIRHALRLRETGR